MASALVALSENEDDDETHSSDWIGFCNNQCKKYASDFIKNWNAYKNDKLISIDHSEVQCKVSEIFSSILNEAMADSSNLFTNDKSPNSLNSINALTSHNNSALEDSNEATSDDCSLESPSLKVPQYTFFRKLSLRGLKKGKFLFFKQPSDEVELSPHHEANSLSSKYKLRNIKLSVECIKEGIVQLLAGDNLDGQLEWLKCRMVLAKLGAGYFIDFYYPPKSLKSRNGVFCVAIREIRETTEMEMPDLRNTFVIKADESKELVVEAKDHADMKHWLQTIISFCSSSQGIMNQSASADFLSNHLSNVKEESGVVRLNMPNSVPPQTVPGDPNSRPVGSADQSAAFSLGTALPIDDTSRNIQALENLNSLRSWVEPSDWYAQLRNYPWFHGMMSRSDASTAVLQDGYDDHGNFLVRQSETRKGEYVLTFNYQARAKHLRLTISPDGICRVQHMSFNTIFDLLEYFRENHIPLESGGATDVVLADFVINEELGDESHVMMSGGNVERRVVTPVARQYMSHGGTVRVSRRAFERLQYDSNNSGGSSGRAVENTYTYT